MTRRDPSGGGPQDDNRTAQDDKRTAASAQDAVVVQDDKPVGLGVRYLGDGEFIPGVPARDLSADEAWLWRSVLISPTGRRLYAAVAATVKAEVEADV
jgi:hypothetical protein